MKGWVDEVKDFPPGPEEDSPLAAMVTAVAGGKPVTALDIARARIEAVDEALKRGVTWAAIGAVYKISGREAKKKIHGLREQVKKAERLGSPP